MEMLWWATRARSVRTWPARSRVRHLALASYKLTRVNVMVSQGLTSVRVRVLE